MVISQYIAHTYSEYGKENIITCTPCMHTSPVLASNEEEYHDTLLSVCTILFAEGTVQYTEHNTGFYQLFPSSCFNFSNISSAVEMPRATTTFFCLDRDP
jgi:hypothetical protein